MITYYNIYYMLYIIYLLYIICMYIYMITRTIGESRVLVKGCNNFYVSYIYIHFNTHIQIHPKYMCPPVIKRENGTSSQHSLFPIKLPASHVRSSPRSCPGTYEDWHLPSQLDVPPLTGAPSWTAMQWREESFVPVYIRVYIQSGCQYILYVYINIQ